MEECTGCSAHVFTCATCELCARGWVTRRTISRMHCCVVASVPKRPLFGERVNTTLRADQKNGCYLARRAKERVLPCELSKRTGTTLPAEQKNGYYLARRAREW
eukprot:6194557-Pleurochrysis_carterae.AAC.1